LFNTIISDSRAISEIWIISVLLKIASLGISDPYFIEKVDHLIETNMDRFAGSAILRLVILIHARDDDNRLRYREYLLKRMRTFNPDSFQDTRLLTQLLICVTALEQPHSPYHGDA
jgi:hypothetical protein